MWDTITMTASQWMHYYKRSFNGFFANMGPDEYMMLTIGAFVAAIFLMRMNFGR